MTTPGETPEPIPAAAPSRRSAAIWRVPVLADLTEQREANVLFTVLRAQVGGLLSVAFVALLTSKSPGAAFGILVASTLPSWLAMWLAHLGRVHWGSYLAITAALLSSMGSTLLFGGTRTSIVLTLVFGPLIASILRGRVALLVVGTLVTAFVFVASFLEQAGVTPLVASLGTTGGHREALAGTVATVVILIAVLYIDSREVHRANEAALEAGRRALASERLLADLVRESPDGIALVAEDGRLTSVNAALERMSGYSSAELLGRHLLDLPGAPAPGTRTVLKEGIEKMGREQVLREIELLRKDGTPYVVETNPRSLELPDGRHLLQVVIRDVTARVEGERRQRRLEQDLVDARRMEGLGRLAGGLAHDLRNMLTPVLMNASELREEPQLPASARPLVEEIEASGRRASELLGQILAFARRQMLDVSLVDLNRELREIEPMLRRLIRGDIDVAFVLEPALRPVRADRGQLGQVVVNLVANARDAMPDGGKLTVETRNVELSDEYAAQHPGVTAGPYSCLIVTDTGAGMTEQVRQHIFEPFFSTKGPDEGVGLGLATVHGIVNQTGGSIHVYSEPGKGATFRVYLPSVAGAVPAVAAPAVPAAPESPQAFRLLVVDDEDLVRSTVVRALRRAGLEVLEARNGDEALALANGFEGRIDLLMSDIVMPGMGGPELARALANSRPEMKVLYLSGYTEQGAFRSGAAPESASLLTKPFMPAELVRRVRSILGQPAG